MNTTLTIKNIRLGDGIPKLCIPITASDLSGITDSAKMIKKGPFDLIEWRADFFEALYDPKGRRTAMELLRNEFPDIPLLFTIRTSCEGGQAEITTEQYRDILLDTINTGCFDLVDAEVCRGDELMKALATASRKCRVKLLASCHNFNSTPPKEDIVRLLCKMQELGANIVKYAVMPTCERDVLTLLDATLTMKEEHPNTPVITMSMGRLGAISRISGELFGSCLTFATAGNASAPGQLPAAVVKEMLEEVTICG